MHGTALPQVMMLQPLRSQQGGGRERTKDLKRVTSLASLAGRRSRKNHLGVRHLAAKYNARGAIKKGVTAYTTKNTWASATFIWLKKHVITNGFAPIKILLLSFSFILRSDDGDGEGDGDHGTDTNEKEKRRGNKGDCISIAKKIALIDEFNALKDGGCLKPNHEPHLYMHVNRKVNIYSLYTYIYIYVRLVGFTPP